MLAAGRSQYIIRNTFSVEKLTYINETGTVIYRSKMSHGNNNKKNFEVYTAEEFIAAHSISLRNHFRWYVTMDGIQINHEGYVTSTGLRDLLMNQ
jgi:hypothetical protein